MAFSIGLGSFLTGVLKAGYGFTKQMASFGMPVSQAVGRGLVAGSNAVGKGFVSAAKGVGDVITAPFSTAENRQRTAANWLGMLKDIGNTMVTRNKDGDLRLSKRGMAAIGLVTMAGKLQDTWYENKAANMGVPDQQPRRPTPDYNPVSYEMHPPKRVTAESGGATGSLVFALHNLRNTGMY